MTGLMLTGATVVTVDADRRVLGDGALYVEDGRIQAVGPTAEIRALAPGADEVDCRGRLVIPGLINTHTHLFQTLLKGLGDDMVLKDWFTCMTGPSAVELTEEDVYYAAAHGCLESIRGGTTTLVDFMYVHPRPRLADAVVRAYEQTGMRGIVARGCLTAGEDVGVPAPLIESVDAYIADAQRLLAEHRDGQRVRIGLAPCMIWSVDTDTLEATRTLADATDAPITMHVSETPFELENAQQRFGLRDLEVLERVGLLGPDVLAVHCVHCNDRDLRILKHRRVGVSHNPCSNLYLASGFAPVPQMLAAGIPVGLASDGPASSNNHSIVQAMKFAALAHKGRHLDATVITAEKALEMATIDGARALGMDAEIGSLEVGKRADLAVLDMTNLAVTPLHNPVSALVYSALGHEPELVMIDGEIVLSEGGFTGVDVAEVQESSQRCADALADRAGVAHFKERPWRSVAF